jgi:hypothetical protein
MAKRGEAEALRYNERIDRVAALTAPDRKADAGKNFAASERRRISSNRFRLAGLAFFIGSLLAFIIGCTLGATAVVAAKEKIEVKINAD